MRVSPSEILPSQDFLKPKTVSFILECLAKGNVDDLPPPPIIRQRPDGSLVAIDGHNIIAVRLFRGEPVEVHLAESASDGLPATSDSNIARNADLAEKFEAVLTLQTEVAAQGISSFQDLIDRYPDLFNQ